MKIGKEVPDFEAKAFHEGREIKVKLSDYRGRWVVLIFYPGDFTFICPTELSEAADYYDEFRKLDAEVLSVSGDTVFVHKAWHDNSKSIKKVKYPMLADPAGNICRMFDTYIDEEGISLRATFIIDPEGILRVADIHDNKIGRRVKEILRRLQAAIYVRENKGEVCPVSWEPGKPTLKPGLDLVGKI